MTDLSNIIVPAIASILTGLFTYLATRNNNSKDTTLSENELIQFNRSLLSEDEKKFRQELMDAITIYKDEIIQLRTEIDELKDLNLSYKNDIQVLSKELNEVKEANKSLIFENEKLIRKVDKLSRQLMLIERKNNGISEQ